MVSEMAGAEKTGQRSYQAGFEVESVSKAGKVKPVKRKEEKKKKPLEHTREYGSKQRVGSDTRFLKWTFTTQTHNVCDR